MKFQPSEVMKLSMPIMVAAWLSRHSLPPKFSHVVIALIMVLLPTLLIAAQPDLGTSILVAASGFFVIFLAGLSWWLIGLAILLMLAFMPVLWFFLMHDYQRQRVLMLLDPEKDPLGRGYHIIQSKIAIGSGGVFGKGWLQGTQSQLEFLPERHTDFIFAVFSEEFGLVGVALLLVLYLYVISRCLFISMQAQNSFERLLGGRHHPHLLRLCVRQHGHGERHSAGGGCSPAAGELWRYLHGDPDGRIRYPDVHPDS